VNILFLDQFSELGGAQRCLLDLIPAIQAEGWNPICALPGGGPLARRAHDLGVDVHPLPVTPLASGPKPPGDLVRFALETPTLARCIGRLVRDARVDLVYANGPRILPAAAWAARRTGRPLVFHCHNHLAQRSAAMLVGRSLQFAGARVIACCRHVARPLSPYIDPDSLRVIYNGVGPISFPRKDSSSGAHIGLIGRVAPEKGHLEFIQAARILVQTHPDSRFTVCGAPLFGDPAALGYFQQVRDAAQELPVEFTGWQETVGAVLAALDLLVVPSLLEPGAPRVILEAYAARVPVVAFVSGGIPEILHDGETGFLVEPPAAEVLAATLSDLLNAPERLREVGESAYTIWKEQFTVDRYQREVVAVIGLTQTRSAIGRSI
jgi:glycosyltransferase involved in cell wall biosynthesis